MSWYDTVKKYTDKVAAIGHIITDKPDTQPDMSNQTYTTSPPTDYTIPIVVVAVGALGFAIYLKKRKK